MRSLSCYQGNIRLLELRATRSYGIKPKCTSSGGLRRLQLAVYPANFHCSPKALTRLLLTLETRRHSKFEFLTFRALSRQRQLSAMNFGHGRKRRPDVTRICEKAEEKNVIRNYARARCQMAVGLFQEALFKLSQRLWRYFARGIKYHPRVCFNRIPGLTYALAT